MSQNVSDTLDIIPYYIECAKSYYIPKNESECIGLLKASGEISRKVDLYRGLLLTGYYRSNWWKKNYSSFDEALASLGISRSQYNVLSSLYRFYIEDQGLTDKDIEGISQQKLITGEQLVKAVGWEEARQYLIELSLSDLRIEVASQLGKEVISNSHIDRAVSAYRVIESSQENERIEEYLQKTKTVKLYGDWKCVVCGSLYNLQAHHHPPRSQGNNAGIGDCFLCMKCHNDVHNAVIYLIRDDSGDTRWIVKRR